MLQLDEIGFAGAVQQFFGKLRRAVQIARDVEKLVQDVAWVKRTQLTLASDIPFLEQVGQPLFIIGYALRLTRSLENLTVFFKGRITNFNLVTDAPQERLINQVSGVQIGRENNQYIERNLDLAPGSQCQIVYAFFDRDNPAIEQIARAHLLTTKVVNQEHAAVGLDLIRCFIEFIDWVVDQVQACQR